MLYYFDVKEIYSKTVCVEADSFEQAEARIQNAYKREEFEIEKDIADSVEFVNVPEDELFEGEDIEEFDCNEIVYDSEQDAYCCPVCNNYIVSRNDLKYLDYSLPHYCVECGAALSE